MLMAMRTMPIRPMSQVMPPKLPDEGTPVSADDVRAALTDIDERIAALKQLRADWVSRAANRSDKNDASAPSSQHSTPVKVAFLGPLGTYSHDAALQMYGEAMQAMPVEGFNEIFAAVESGEADFGVAPIENSTEGAVNQTHDLLVQSNVHIGGEIRLRIQHCLLSSCDDLSAITAVHAHPQSLAQCRQWLNANLPGVELISESSNAAAAEAAASASTSAATSATNLAPKRIAAIASASAGTRYGLNALAQGIEDITNNTTRFIVIGLQPSAPTGQDVTSLLMSASHKPGGLRRMLQPLEDAGVNMTRIESRPARTQMWEYVFFIDVTGHHEDEKLSTVLKTLKEETPLLRVLGSYPRARA